MAYIFASGTGSAAPTGAWATLGRRLGAALILVGMLPAASLPARLDLGLAGLRSDRGVVRICLTRDPAHFPDCQSDPVARHATVPAGQPLTQFGDLPSGDYAIALFHDENANGRLDRVAGIPTEGVGFSNNPRLMFGPPRFVQSRFAVTNLAVDETVRMKYFL